MDDDFVVITFDDPNHNKLAGLASATTISIVAAVIAVVLRFWSRRLSRAGIGWDDWLIVLALIVALAEYAQTIAWITIGGARDMGDVTPRKLREALTLIFVTDLFYGLCLFLVRASALVLWPRIFSWKTVQVYCWFWRIINGLWVISIIVTACLQCRPLKYFWEPLDPAYEEACQWNVKTWYIAVAVVGIITDTAIVGLPLALCFRLKLNKTMKISLAAMFATGFLVTILSGVRLKILQDSVLGPNMTGLAALNLTWIYGPTGMWSNVEMFISIVSACLPCLRPVLAKIVPAKWVPKALQRPKTTTAGRYTFSKTGKGTVMTTNNTSFSTGSRALFKENDPDHELTSTENLGMDPRGRRVSDEETNIGTTPRAHSQTSWHKVRQTGNQTLVHSEARDGRSSPAGILVQEDVSVHFEGDTPVGGRSR